jgi:thioredoxin-related protein
MMNRLYKAVLAGCVFLCLASAVHGDTSVPAGTDLQADGQQARDRQLPVLLEFGAAYCVYCRQLEREFLVPMLISGEYTDRVIMRRLQLDSGLPVTDFDGTKQPPAAIARRYRVLLTPTLVFVDGGGNELTEHITGFNTPELFGGYLDACVETALLKIRTPASTLKFAGCGSPAP